MNPERNEGRKKIKCITTGEGVDKSIGFRGVLYDRWVP